MISDGTIVLGIDSDCARIRCASVTTAVVTERQLLETYAGEWNELLSSSKANTIFLTWEWVSTWLDTVYPDVRLCVVVARSHDGQLIAIAPFYCSDLRLLNIVRYKVLRVIGDCQAGSEYGDVITRSGYENVAMACVMSELLRHQDLWDCIWLRNMAWWTGARQRCTDAWSELGLYIRERTRHFAAVALPDAYEAYLAQLSQNGRAHIRRHDRRLRAMHSIEVVPCDSQDKVPEFLSHLFALHRRRWESVGQAGSFARRPLMKRFYESFAPVAWRQGWLRLYALQVDGIIRAVQYGYAYRGVFSQLQEGYEPNGFAGIGNLLRNQVIRACIQEGLREYDFLGGYSDHKRRWGARLVNGCDLFIGRRSLKTNMLFWKNIWPSGRLIRQGRPANEGQSHG